LLNNETEDPHPFFAKIQTENLSVESFSKNDKTLNKKIKLACPMPNTLKTDW
jgi:hypothetical protein